MNASQNQNQQPEAQQDARKEAQAAKVQRMMRSAAGGGRGIVREIREFATRGNVLDLSVGVTVGATLSQGFSKMSSSLIHDILSPLTGIVSRFDLAGFYLNLSGRSFDSLAQAKAAGAPVIAYGEFVSQLLDFGLVAAILMVAMRGLNRFKRGQEIEPVARECPFCLSSIPLKATRCRFCTSQLPVEAPATDAAPVAA